MVGCTTSEKMRALALCNTINGGLHTIRPIFSDRNNQNRQEGIKLLKKKRKSDKKTDLAETQTHHVTDKFN